MVSASNTPRWNALISRAVLFCFIWWLLTDGAVASWWIGVPTVVLAVIVSTAISPASSFVWFRFILFIPFFLTRSILGGIDVARRAFHPAMPITPELIEYPLRLQSELPLVLMVNIINLLPGTLSAAIDKDVLKVHVLDASKEFITEIAAVEQKVAQMFGISPQAPEEAH